MVPHLEWGIRIAAVTQLCVTVEPLVIARARRWVVMNVCTFYVFAKTLRWRVIDRDGQVLIWIGTDMLHNGSKQCLHKRLWTLANRLEGFIELVPVIPNAGTPKPRTHRSTAFG